MLNKILKIAFVVLLVVVVLVFGYLIYKKIVSKPVNVSQPVPQTQPSTTPQTAQITFSIENPNNVNFECTKLSASPIQGSAPLTVDFSATATNYSDDVTNPSQDSIQFVISYDDLTPDETKVSNSGVEGITLEEFTHIYKDSGIYQPTIVVKSGEQTFTSKFCTVTITVLGQTAKDTSLSPTSSAVAVVSQKPLLTQIVSTTPPTPTLKSISPSPTVKPTTTLKPSPTIKITTTGTADKVPVPDVPKAGGIVPTLIAGIGGIALIIITLLAL